LTVPAFASAFTDVPDDSYYADAVAWAVDQGITTGTSSTTFSPTQDCTKAEIITFIWRSQGSPAASISNPYSDLSGSEYYATAAIWAYEQGMIDSKVFSGSTPCTRSMAVEYIWKNAGSPEGSKTAFTDVSASSSYAAAVAWAVQQGITDGTSTTTFSPNVVCSRAQIVTFLKRYDKTLTSNNDKSSTPNAPDSGATADRDNSKVPVSVDTPYMYNATGGKNSVSVSWKSVSNATGYEVHQGTSTSGAFQLVKTVTGSSSHEATITELDAGTTYYFKVRAYVDSNGERTYSAFSVISWAMTAADEGFSLEIKTSLPVSTTNTGGKKATITDVKYGTAVHYNGIQLSLNISGKVIESGKVSTAPVGQAVLYERDSDTLVDTYLIMATSAKNPGDTFSARAYFRELKDIPYVLEIVSH
jgi:hypothetical protein